MLRPIVSAGGTKQNVWMIVSRLCRLRVFGSRGGGLELALAKHPEVENWS